MSDETYEIHGVSTGETGICGVGDILSADSSEWDPDEMTLGSEPIFYAFIINNNKIEVLD